MEKLLTHSVIVYNGIKTKNNIPFISFKNDEGYIVEIPIDLITADRISKYLGKICYHMVPGDIITG